MRMLSTKQALERLKEAKITDSIQMLNKWLREGVLKGIKSASKKEGWSLPEDELERFIALRIPPEILVKEIDILKEEIKTLREENEDLRAKLAVVTPSKDSIPKRMNKYDLAKLENSSKEYLSLVEQVSDYLEITYKPTIVAEESPRNYVGELGLDDIFLIWHDECLRWDSPLKVKEEVYDQLKRGLLGKMDRTNLYQLALGKYVCPFTQDWFDSPNRLVVSAVTKLFNNISKGFNVG